VIDFILHSDKHLLDLVATYGPWVYAGVVRDCFAETGFVVTPFLPGDSLLFAAGALAATGVLNPWVVDRAAGGRCRSSATPSTMRWDARSGRGCSRHRAGPAFRIAC
jgi:hypothetical protein